MSSYDNDAVLRKLYDIRMKGELQKQHPQVGIRKNNIMNIKNKLKGRVLERQKVIEKTKWMKEAARWEDTISIYENFVLIA